MCDVDQVEGSMAYHCYY